LINAGKQPVTQGPGAAFFHHADRFALMRGGHLDICVPRAFQVAANGDLANWPTREPDATPAAGRAMEPDPRARRVSVVLDHRHKSGEPKIVERCTSPLSGVRCVTRIYTGLAVIDVTPDGLVARDWVEGLSFDELRRATGAPLADGRATATA